MVYHVNEAGNTGLCQAKKGGCPFGDESQHYESEIVARMHYEASMNGLTFETHLKNVLAKEEAHARARAFDAAHQLTPTTVIPEPVYEDQWVSVNPRNIEIGKKVIIDGRNNVINAIVTEKTANDVIMTTTDGREIEYTFVRGKVKEIQQVQTQESKDQIRIAERERAIEEKALTSLPRSRSALRDTLGDMGQSFKFLAGDDYTASPTSALSFYTRLYKEKVANYKRNGMSIPYTRALKDLDDANIRKNAYYSHDAGNIDYRAKQTLRFILTGERAYGFNDGQREAVKNLYPEHSRPVLS